MAEDYAIAIRIDPGATIPTATRISVELGKAEVAGERVGQAMTRGLRAGSSAAEGATRATQALTRELGMLAAAAGATFALRGVVEMLDGYTQISNRLNTVAKDQQNLNGLMEASHGIAQDTFQGWGVTAEAVVRFSNATKELGLSQRQVLDFTKSYQQAVALAGAKTSEQAAAVQQLGQALGSGKLAGDELKSIGENAPIVLDIIAKGMGRTRGEIKQLGSEGKITAEVIVDAFTKAAPDLEQKFGKIVPTMEQSFVRLKNEATRFFGEAGQGAGIMRGLSQAMQFVVDHFDTFAKVALGVGQALVGLYVLEKVIGLVKLLTAAVAANPLGALLVALVTAIALLRQFGDQLDAGADGVTKVSDVLGVLWDDIKSLAGAVYDFLEGAWKSLTGAFSDGLESKGIEFSLKNVLTLIASFADAAISIFRAMGTTIAILFEAIFNKIIDSYNWVADKVNSIGRVAQKATGLATRMAAAGGAQGMIDDAKEKYLKPAQASSDPAERDALMKKYFAAISASDVKTSDMLPQYERIDLLGPGNRAHKLGDAWGKDFESSAARDYIAGLFERAGAAAANQAPKVAGTVSGAAGVKGAKPPTKEELTAAKKAQTEYDKLARALESIERASNPATEAMTKYEKAVDIVTRATQTMNPTTKEMMLSLEDGQDILLETATRLADARFPLEAWNREIDKEIASLGLSNKERERANELLQATEDLKKKGITITPEVQAGVEGKLDLKRSAELAAKYREMGPLNEYKRGIEETTELLQHGSITTKQYEESIRSLEDAYFDASHAGTSFEDGLARGLRSIRDEATDVAASIETALTNAFHGVEDAIVSLVTKGEINWSQFVESMLADLTKLLMHQAFAAALGRGAGGGGGTMDNLMTGLSAIGLGFAGGGEGRIAGSGPPDSKLFVARVTPGEHYRFTPPGRDPDPAPAPSAPPQVHVMIVDNEDKMRRFVEDHGETYYHVHERRSSNARRGRTTGR